MSAIDPASKLTQDPMCVALSFLTSTELAVCNSLSKPWQKQTDKESLWKTAVFNMLASHGASVEVKEEIDSWKRIFKAFKSMEKTLIKKPNGDASINSRMIDYTYTTSFGMLSCEGRIV